MRVNFCYVVSYSNSVRTAQLVGHKTGTIEVMGSNPGKREDFSDPNLNCNICDGLDKAKFF